MTLKTSIFITILLLPWMLVAQTKIRIPVGAYIFPPYYELQDGKPMGLTVDTLAILNRMQGEFEFVITEMNPQRRYKMFEELQIEAVFFEDPAWQWNKTEHYKIPLGLKDEEVYFALAAKSEQPNYFDNLKSKRFVLVQGYHYQFAGMDADETHLKKNYQLHFVHSYEASILFVLGGRADVGIAPRSYLHTYFQKHPEQQALIRIGNKPDHSFSLKVILSKKSKISKVKMKALIEQLTKNPEYKKSLTKYGLN